MDDDAVLTALTGLHNTQGAVREDIGGLRGELAGVRELLTTALLPRIEGHETRLGKLEQAEHQREGVTSVRERWRVLMNAAIAAIVSGLVTGIGHAGGAH